MASNVLSEKEKETLRLIVRGHDAKSIARHFNLSVHTVNERLRDARRKMAVSSSREAARQLFDQEGATHKSLGDTLSGEAATPVAVEQVVPPENGGKRTRRSVLIISGVVLMSLILALAAVTSLPQATPSPTDSTPSATVSDAEVEGAARQFLTLIDQGKWDASYALTTDSFHRVNTAKVWADVSEKVRPPLGAMKSRIFLSHDDVPAPPAGYEVVKFRTSFANKPNAIEKVSLERSANGWRVAGVWIE